MIPTIPKCYFCSSPNVDETETIFLKEQQDSKNIPSVLCSSCKIIMVNIKNNFKEYILWLDERKNNRKHTEIYRQKP